MSTSSGTMIAFFIINKININKINIMLLYIKKKINFFCSIFYVFILDPKIKTGVVNLENYRKKISKL